MKCLHCESQQFKIHHNFVKIHTSLRVTPAMAANATDHLWTIEEMLNAEV
jgi:hypothetical protein